MKKGFTLLEILLVIAAIGILAAIVIVAINPNRQLSQVRDTQRQSNVNNIQKALTQYSIDNSIYPLAITDEGQEICAPGGSVDCIDLSSELVPVYLAQIPVDSDATGDGSGYRVGINPINSRLFVESLYYESEERYGINLPSLLLDDFVGVEIAYSLRKLRSNYTGSAIRVRRGSDNAEQDIGFTSVGTFDVSALEAFVSGSDGYVVSWYDQSGNGIDAQDTASITQPRIANGSGQTITLNSVPAVLFDPTSRYSERELYASGISISEADLYAVANFRDTALNDIVNSDLIHLYDGGNDGYRMVRYDYPGGNYQHVIFQGTSSNFLEYSSVDLDQNLYYSRMADGEQIMGINGSNIGQNTVSSPAGLPANQLYIGDDSTQADAFYGHLQEMILFDGDTSSDRSAIESAINDYYQIY
jgi:prepilin-type N-terminal cleavage/methylation domain-containing protein